MENMESGKMFRSGNQQNWNFKKSFIDWEWKMRSLKSPTGLGGNG